MPEIHSHVAGTLSNQQTNKHPALQVDLGHGDAFPQGTKALQYWPGIHWNTVHLFRESTFQSTVSKLVSIWYISGYHFVTQRKQLFMFSEGKCFLQLLNLYAIQWCWKMLWTKYGKTVHLFINSSNNNTREDRIHFTVFMYIPEIHFACYWDAKQPGNNSFYDIPVTAQS